jgi:hypothetical protein
MSRAIHMSRHALHQCALRGTNDREVRLAIERGVREPAKRGRWMYRYNASFNADWQGKRYSIKQVAPVVAEQDDSLIVITVYTFYF